MHVTNNYTTVTATLLKFSTISCSICTIYFLQTLQDVRYNVPSCSSDAITMPVVELIADTFGYIRLVSRFESNNWYVILAGNYHPAIFSDVAEKVGMYLFSFIVCNHYPFILLYIQSGIIEMKVTTNADWS